LFFFCQGSCLYYVLFISAIYLLVPLIFICIVWRLYKTGWIDNWIYWISHSYTQLQCINFITHNNWVYSLPLKTSDPTLQPLLQPTLMAYLAITHSLTGNCPRNSELYSPWTDRKENTHWCIDCCCLGTDHIENAGRFHCCVA
jgi:hypothetical protein